MSKLPSKQIASQPTNRKMAPNGKATLPALLPPIERLPPPAPIPAPVVKISAADQDMEAFLIGQLAVMKAIREAAMESGTSFVAAEKAGRTEIEIKKELETLRKERASAGSPDQLSEPEMFLRLEAMAERMPPQHLAIFARLWATKNGLTWPLVVS